MTPSETVLLTRLRNRTDRHAVRTAAGLSLAEVGRACRVSASTVHRWERGEAVPHGRPAVAYARLLDALDAL